MRIYTLLVILFLLTSESIAKNDEYLTDKELLHICLRNSVVKVATDIVAKGYTEICVVEPLQENNEASNFLLIGAFSKEMMKHNGKLFLKTNNAEGGEYLFSFRIIEERVDIKEKCRFFGEAIIERNAKVKISYRLVASKTGAVLIAEKIEESLENDIPRNAYRNLTGKIDKGGLSFTNLLEPAIVTAIVGSLMYFFYSHKSSQ